MLYTVGMFLNFSLTNIVFEIYYYNIYKNKQTINKIKLIGIFFLKLSLLLLAFIVADYDSILINLTLYVTNIFPLLFIYNDTLKNKILNYLIINYYFAIIEMLISALFVIILLMFGFKIYFPKELSQMHSSLFFVPIPFIFFTNFYVANHLENILKYAHSNKKNSFLLLLTFFLLVLNISIIFSSTKNNFLFFSIIYIILLLIILCLLNICINNFIISYKKNIHNKYLLEISNKQKEQLQSIDENFKKIRKRNHDFTNHLIIIFQLFKNNDLTVINYLDNLLHNHNDKESQ